MRTGLPIKLRPRAVLRIAVDLSRIRALDPAWSNYPIRYWWIDGDGARGDGVTVGDGLTRADALNRFLAQNPHLDGAEVLT